MEVYLNVVEFGPGSGGQAASRPISADPPRTQPSPGGAAGRPTVPLSSIPAIGSGGFAGGRTILGRMEEGLIAPRPAAPPMEWHLPSSRFR